MMRPPNFTHPILATLLLTLSLPAFALYRCEKDGQISFQDTPCPAGSNSTFLREPAPVSASELATAKRLAQEEKIQLAKYQAERAKQAKQDSAEAKSRHNAANKAKTQEAKCSALALKQKWAEQDLAKITSNDGPKILSKAQSKAHRAAEKYHSVCGSK